MQLTDLNLYPLPNGRTFAGGRAEFISSVSNATDEDFAPFRVDQRFTDSDNFFARYSFDDAERALPNA
ncbi:MAG: hypothetical protein HY652_11595, partial [Acidobacteria bacterium]|nr:hypothetical protein [Acidobacteriota bacterium]